MQKNNKKRYGNCRLFLIFFTASSRYSFDFLVFIFNKERRNSAARQLQVLRYKA